MTAVRKITEIPARSAFDGSDVLTIWQRGRTRQTSLYDLASYLGEGTKGEPGERGAPGIPGTPGPQGPPGSVKDASFINPDYYPGASDTEKLNALMNESSDTRMVVVNKANPIYDATQIPLRARDNVFQWAQAPGGGRPTFPGLHILPIGSRLEVFRGKTRTDDYSDILFSRDTRAAAGIGAFGNNNAQIRIENFAINATTFEWPLIVTQTIDGSGTGEHVGITAYATRKGPGGGMWNFVGGMQDWLAAPNKAARAAELGFSARGPDTNGQRCILDLPTSSFRFAGGERDSFGNLLAASADPQSLTGEIKNGVLIAAAYGAGGIRGDARVTYPFQVNNLWGFDQGAYNTQALEAVNPGLNSRIIHLHFESLPLNGQTREFGIRERRSGAVVPGSEKQSISIDFFRQEGGVEETALSLEANGLTRMTRLVAERDIATEFGAFRQASRTAIAASGTTTETAYQLDTGVSLVQSGSGGGVRFRAKIGELQTVCNRSGGPISVYPPLGMNIETFGTNFPISVADGGNIAVIPVNGTLCVRVV